MKKTNLYLYFLLTWISCATSSSQVQKNGGQYLQSRKTSYRIDNNIATAFLTLVDNVWYQDSVGITEINSIRSLKTGTTDSFYSATIGYRMTDMRKAWVYEYRNLSDTAAIVRKYANADSQLVTGGWNFYRRSTIQFDSLHATGDTIFGGVTYQKYRYIQDFHGKRFLSEVLSRCDKKGSIFLFDKGLSKAIGCPGVRITVLTPDGKLPMEIGEIKLISNEIPDSVQHVLSAWKRNLYLYPAQ